MPAANPSATIVIREHRGQPFYEAKFRYRGQQVKRRIGPAWLERDTDAGWCRRRGRLPDDAYDERRAHVAAAQLVADYVSDAENVEQVEQERRARGVTFREIAAAYLRWLGEVRGFARGSRGIGSRIGGGSSSGPVSTRDHRARARQPARRGPPGRGHRSPRSICWAQAGGAAGIALARYRLCRLGFDDRSGDECWDRILDQVRARTTGAAGRPGRGRTGANESARALHWLGRPRVMQCIWASSG
jgi:hypothetical protein